MSMSSGGPSAPQRQPSMGRRNMSRAITMRTDGYSGEEEGPIIESELVPSSLAPIVPILRAANEIEEENPRVAYLCRFTAFEKAHTMDPNSSGRGVRQFKTYLLHRLEKDEKDTQRRLASTDAKEIQRFYEHYCRKYLEEGLQTRKPDEMARYYQIASVLYDVLKTVTPDKPNSEYDQYAKGVEKEKASFSHYNILPLNISGPAQPVMEIPEIKAAVALLRRISNLPKPRPDTTDGPQEIDDGPIVRDLLDWLWQTFGFQKGNVENQKEHLILLLANIDMRRSGNIHQGERQNHVIQRDTVDHLMKKVFQNYISWCRYLHLESNIKIPHDASTQQPELLYIGLYLLIWGEASNVRFMPECLCYIFHHMARDLYDIISDRREDSFDPPFRREGSDDAFLQLVIQPIYNVIHNEATMSKRGTVSHSKWRNYDDLNEYFWSKKCFKQLRWPMDPASDFFADPTKTKNDIEGEVVLSRGCVSGGFGWRSAWLALQRTPCRWWWLSLLAVWAAGDWWWVARALFLSLAMAPPRSGPGELKSFRLSCKPRVARGSCRAKALRFVADDGDACWRRYLPEDVVLFFLFVPGFRVKTLVPSRLGSDDAWHHFPSWGVVVELRCLGHGVALYSVFPMFSFGSLVGAA